MPSGHRHGTDRTETTVIGECVEGCQGFVLDAEGRDESVEELIETAAEAFDTCSKCGAPIGTVRRDEPSETLD